MKVLKLFSDGGSRHNPGPSALGFVLRDEGGKLLVEQGKFLGVKTNNEAEYLGLIEGLEEASKFIPAEINCFLDSELVVLQLKGSYQVKNPRMRELYERVKVLEKSFQTVTYSHIPRKENERADFLLNQVLDENSKQPFDLD